MWRRDRGVGTVRGGGKRQLNTAVPQLATVAPDVTDPNLAVVMAVHAAIAAIFLGHDASFLRAPIAPIDAARTPHAVWWERQHVPPMRGDEPL